MARAYELWFGQFGDYHLTVSEAMKKNLAQIAPAVGRKPIQVLYDRATPKFRLTSMQEKAELYNRINLEDQLTNSLKPTFNSHRPVLLLSSTSYTPDEDFMILVKALAICDDKPECPQIQMIVTGKGPQKALYDQVFREWNSKWKKTNIR